MLKRHPLLLPLILSILIHALVIAVGEKIGGRTGKAGGKKAVPASYDLDTAEDDPPAAPAPGRDETNRDSKGFEVGILSLETSNPLYRSYLAEVRQKIGTRWKDPRRKGDAGKSGSAAVEFHIKSSGGLLSVEVSESSGVKSLDFSAIKAVKRAAPFGAFPPYILPKSLKIKALFVYD